MINLCNKFENKYQSTGEDSKYLLPYGYNYDGSFYFQMHNETKVHWIEAVLIYY